MSVSLAPKKSEYALLKEQAADFFASGLLHKSIQKLEQVIFVMEMARELNLPPVQALNGIRVIEGKATVSPQFMMEIIESSGKLKKKCIRGDATFCEVEMIRKGQESYTETFTNADAERMKLTEKPSWKQQPTMILRGRAIAACARVVFPDLIKGLYLAEEVEIELPTPQVSTPKNRLETHQKSSVLEGEIVSEIEDEKESKILSLPSPKVKEEEPNTKTLSEKINGNSESENVPQPELIKKEKAILVKRYLEKAVQHLKKGKEWLEESMKSRNISYDSITEHEYKEFKEMSFELTEKGLEADLEMLKSSLEKKGVPKEETEKLGIILSNPATPEMEMERVKKKLETVDDSLMVSDSDIAVLVTYAEFLGQKEVAEEADNILRDGIGYAKMEFMEIVEKLGIGQSGKSN